MNIRLLNTKSVILFSGLAFLLLSIPAVFQDASVLNLLPIVFFWAAAFRGHRCAQQSVMARLLAAGIGLWKAWDFYTVLIALKSEGAAHIPGKWALLASGLLLFVCAFPFLCFSFDWLISDSEKSVPFLEGKKMALLSSALVVISLVCQIAFSFNYSVWIDEAFSLSIIEHSYADMLALAAKDVHPPFYYLILKTFVDGIHLLFPQLPSVFLAKLCSALPIAILAVYLLARSWSTSGNARHTCLLAAVAVTALSNLPGYGVEIRMYSWAFLFVSLSYIAVHDLMVYPLPGFKSWICFSLGSLAAAYTHYFACVAVAVLWLILGIQLLLQLRKELKHWLAAGVCTVIGYLPWLLIFLKQAQVVSESYWIAPINLQTLDSYISWIFDYDILFIVCCIVLSLFAALFARSKAKDGELLFSFAGICVPVATIGIGVLFSILLRPLFVIRYVVPGLGCLWMGLLCGLHRLSRKRLYSFLTVIILAVGIIHAAQFVETEYTDLSHGAHANEFYQSLDDAVFITDDGHVQGTIAYMSDSTCYRWKANQNELFKEVFGNLGSLGSHEELQALVNSDTAVYFAQTKESFGPDALLEGSTLQWEFVGEYVAEYPVKMYRITQ